MLRLSKIVAARFAIGVLIVPMSILLMLGMVSEWYTKLVEKSMAWYKETMIKLRTWSED